MTDLINALTEPETVEVSLVGRGANKKRTAFVKSEEHMAAENEAMEVLKDILDVEFDDAQKVEEILKEAKISDKAANALKGALKLLAAHKDEMPEDALKVLANLSGLAFPQKAGHDDEEEEKKRKAKEEEEAAAAKKKKEEEEEDKPPFLKGKGMKTPPIRMHKDDGSIDPDALEFVLKDVPEAMRPQLAALWKSQNQESLSAIKKNAELEAILKEERDIRRTGEFIKKAEEQYPFITGEPAEMGKLLKSLHDSDKDSAGKVEELLKKLNNQMAKSELYKVKGSRGGADTDAIDAIEAKAVELRKSDPKLTKEQAFVKVVKSHPELRSAYYAEKGQ